jgi:hypothetical protein
MSPSATGAIRALDRCRERLQSADDAALLLRMLPWALALPVLRRSLRLDTLARLMWSEPRGNAPRDVDRIVELSRLVVRRRPRMSENRCLERSLLAYRFLSARSAEPKLVVALRESAGHPRGHAWVKVGGAAVGELLPLDDYVPIVVYGRDGRREG